MSVYDRDVYGERCSSTSLLGVTSDGLRIMERYVGGKPVIYVGRPISPYSK